MADLPTEMPADAQALKPSSDTQPLAALQAEVAELRCQLQAQHDLQKSLNDSEQRFRALISSLQVGVVVQGSKAEILLCNAVSLELLGLTEAEYLGRSSFDPRWQIQDEQGAPFEAERRPVARVLSTGREVRNVVMSVYRPRKSDWVWLLVNAVPQLDAQGGVKQVVSTFTDITALRHAEERTRQLADDLLSLSTPCIPIADGVVILPLIGRFDQVRGQHALATLLHYVTQHRVRAVLLDLTGLLTADTWVTQMIGQIVSAVGLLGAMLFLSGIRGKLAKELVQTGQSLSSVPTFATLQQGVRALLAGPPR